MRVNSLENKIPDATTLIQINQYKTDKQSLKKKVVIIDKEIPGVSGLVLLLLLMQKLVKLKTKYQIIVA